MNGESKHNFVTFFTTEGELLVQQKVTQSVTHVQPPPLGLGDFLVVLNQQPCEKLLHNCTKVSLDLLPNT